MTLALDIRDLSKSFGSVHAVNQLDLSIPQGEFHALLGPNGAGKTTTLRMVAGLIRPDRGSIRVMGHDVVQDPIAAKRMLAFLPEDPLLYGKLRPLEYLEFVAGLWQVEAQAAAAHAEELLRMLDLQDKTGALIESLSRGMRQKLALAGALIHHPKVMILDEPLTGLDAAAARQVKDLLVAQVSQGMTIILTTHILEIAERLAGRISIVNAGRVIAQGSLDQLRSQSGLTDGGNASLEDVFLGLTQKAHA